MFRRLDDKVRELCAWALASQDPSELREITRQLRAALREHIKRIRISAVNAPSPERRSDNIKRRSGEPLGEPLKVEVLPPRESTGSLAKPAVLDPSA